MSPVFQFSHLYLFSFSFSLSKSSPLFYFLFPPFIDPL
jgi:hypothetical protein